MWFEALTGFREESPEQVRKNMSVDGYLLKSHANGIRRSARKTVCFSKSERMHDIVIGTAHKITNSLIFNRQVHICRNHTNIPH